jgi:hypothetical protein
MSAKKAFATGALPENIPVNTLVTKNIPKLHFFQIAHDCNPNPKALPNKLIDMIFFLPMTSLILGHVKSPMSIPAGYAEVSDPNDAPVGRPKCFPSVGFRGDVSVNPRRLRLVAARIVKIVKFVFDFCDKEKHEGDEEVVSPLECKS